jgi:hypothetical protein
MDDQSSSYLYRGCMSLVDLLSYNDIKQRYQSHNSGRFTVKTEKCCEGEEIKALSSSSVQK